MAQRGVALGWGQEHEVRLSADGQWAVKVTVPSREGYGLTPFVRRGRAGWEIGLRAGTPREYLSRLALHNAVFGDDWRYAGLVSSGGSAAGSDEELPAIITVQPFLLGGRPGAVEIDRYFRARGFSPVAGQEAKTFYRAADNLAAFDAHEGNLIKTGEGLAPIDIVIIEPDDALLLVLEQGLE